MKTVYLKFITTLFLAIFHLNLNPFVHSQSLSDGENQAEQISTDMMKQFSFGQSQKEEEKSRSYRHLALEVEPVAYLLNGAGIHGRYQYNNMRYSVEVFGVDIPGSLHGNNGFDASVYGVELHFEYFFRDSEDGYFLGPEIGISNFEITHQESGVSRNRTQYGAGLRGGYRWYTGLGELYLAPVAGVVYTLNSTDIEIEGDVYESGPVTPFATLGIGWSFEL